MGLVQERIGVNHNTIAGIVKIVKTDILVYENNTPQQLCTMYDEYLHTVGMHMVIWGSFFGSASSRCRSIP